MSETIKEVLDNVFLWDYEGSLPSRNACIQNIPCDYKEYECYNLFKSAHKMHLEISSVA